MPWMVQLGTQWRVAPWQGVSTLETSVSVGRSVSAAMSLMRVALPWLHHRAPSAVGTSGTPATHVEDNDRPSCTDCRQALQICERSEHLSAVQGAKEWTASGHGACRETE